MSKNIKKYIAATAAVSAGIAALTVLLAHSKKCTALKPLGSANGNDSDEDLNTLEFSETDNDTPREYIEIHINEHVSDSSDNGEVNEN